MSYKKLGMVRNKPVYITIHAQERAELRKISDQEIVEALRLNMINVPGKGKTRKIFGTVAGRRVVVYVEERERKIVVTTVAAPDEG